MSNTRKRKPASSSNPPRGTDPVLALEAFNAALLTKPDAEPLVALGLRGMNISTGKSMTADFVMFPAEARALIAELRRAVSSA